MTIPGLIPDGYTDCADAINRALVTLGERGGALQLPPGNILLQSPLTIQRGTVSLLGAGREATRLLVASDQGIAISVGDPYQQVARVRIGDLTINTTRMIPQGAGIRIFSAVDVRVSNCLIANLHCGIEIQNSSFIYVTDTEIIDPTPQTGVGILLHGDGVHNDHYFTRVFVQSRGHTTPCEVGYRLVNSQGLWMNSCGAFHCGIGIHLMAHHGKTLEHAFFANNAVDSCSGNGFLINAGPGGTVRRVQSSGDWSCSNKGSGVLVDSGDGAIEDIQFLHTRVYGNAHHGVFLRNVQSAVVDGATIAGNGSCGIALVENCGTVAIRNNIIGAYAGYGITQTYAIYGLENARRGMVTNNIFEAHRDGVFSAPAPHAMIANNMQPPAP